MPDPFNYNIESPMSSFKQAYAFGTALAERDKATARAQEVQKALTSVQTDRSPENLARVMLAFPELKEQVTTSESILNEKERTAANALRSEVISLYKTGNRDAARSRLETQANAYANTPGKEKEAKAAQTMLQAFDKNPDAVILPMTIQLAQSDEKLYKNLFDNSEMTTFQKNLVAAGIDPKSNRGVALSEQYAVNQADPLVEVETPSGGKFVGPRSEYFRRYGANAPAPNKIPAPSTKEAYDALPSGTQYRAPDGSLKVKGGQTATNVPSGDFR